MKIKNLFKIIPIFTLCYTLIIPTTISATVLTEPTSSIVTIEADLSNPSSYENELNTLLSQDSISEVHVIDKSLALNNSIAEQPILTIDDTPDPLTVTIYRYRLTNLTSGADFTDYSNKIATASGQPNMTLTISKSSSVQNTYSLSAGISSEVNTSTISAGVGYDVTSSTDVTISVEDTVPSKNNGKKVKKMTLNVYPILKTTNFTVQRHRSVNGLNYGWSDYGTGYARQAYGVAFTKQFTYQ